MHSKSARIGFFSAWVTMTLAMLPAGRVAADEFNRQASLYQRLLTPLTCVIDGKPFRDAIDRVAAPAGVNYWLDRRVDPTIHVDAGELGPNVYACLKRIAAERDCVLMPVAGVLLIGRPNWVETSAAGLLKLTSQQSPKLIDLRWEDLTTPSEALRKAKVPASFTAHVPHDLWPKTSWKRVDQHVAAALVLAQFDRGLKPGKLTSSSVFELQSGNANCQRLYRASGQVEPLQQDFKDIDRDSKVTVDGDKLTVVASVAAHRKATDRLLQRLAAKAPAAVGDDVTFSLKLVDRAGAALVTFATKSGRKCIIQPEAQEACQKVVTLEAENKTLQDLSTMVATQAGVKIKWGDKTVVVSK